MRVNNTDPDKCVSICNAFPEEYEQYAVKLSKLEIAMEQGNKQTSYLQSLLAGE